VLRDDLIIANFWPLTSRRIAVWAGWWACSGVWKENQLAAVDIGERWRIVDFL